MYPEKNMAQKDTRTPVFTAALFTMAKTQKQPKCPSTGKDKEDMAYIHICTHTRTQRNTTHMHTHTHTHTHTMEYYSVSKKNEIRPFAAT